MNDRTATDTIKGYFYQFDYTIKNLLELTTDTDTITVEGIEDVDLATATEETAIQCKYYSKTEYNHSVIGKPIRLMLEHFTDVKNGNKKRINYKLYGHFQKGQEKLSLPIDTTFLKDNFLTFTENKVRQQHHIYLSLTDTDLNNFLSLLTIDISALKYETQLENIFKLFIQIFKCTQFEAEHFYYNNSLKVIKDLSVEGDIVERKIEKKEFLKRINFKGVLFNTWFIEVKGENKLFAELRKEYFTHLNVSPFERFFLIEIPDIHYLRSDLKDLLINISKKWSKLSAREPNPFCPYVYLYNIPEKELVELKSELYSEGFTIADGHYFQGSKFDPISLSKQVSSSNPIKLKIINKKEDLELTLDKIKKTKELYQFYSKSSFFKNDYPNIKHVRIQFSDLKDIKKII